MNTLFRLCIVFAALLSTSPSVLAQDDPVDAVMAGCASEIQQYCSQVTLGEGRLLACFFAHEDKLSGQCQYSLYSAAVQLEEAVNALVYLAEECDEDIMAHCADVQLGEGRVIECLQAAGEAVSEECSTAMDEVIEFE